MTARRLRAYRKTMLFFAILIALLAVFFTLGRIASPVIVKRASPDLATRLSKILHQPVVIETVTSSWYHFQPTIRFKNIYILDAHTKTPTVSIDNIDVGINVWRSILNGQFKIGIVIVSGLHVVVRQNSDNSFAIAGLPFFPPIHLFSGSTINGHFFNNMLAIANIKLDKASLDWLSPTGKVTQVSNVRLEIINSDPIHHIEGNFEVVKPSRTQVDFKGDLHGDFVDPRTNKANLYVHANNLQVAQWFSLYQFDNLSLADGTVSFVANISWEHNLLQSLKTSFKVSSLKIEPMPATNNHPQQSLDGSDSLFLRSLSGDVSWLRQAPGWQLTGNNIRIIDSTKAWPVTSLSIKTVETDERILKQSFYVNYLSLDPIIPLLSRWSAVSQSMQNKLQQIRPMGELFNFYLERYPSNTLNAYAVTTQFRNLSAQATTQTPGFSGLSGSVIGSPRAGLLTLNSRNVTASPQYFSKGITFLQLKANVEWLRDKSSWIVTSPGFYASNADVAIRGTGTVLQAKKQATPEIKLLVAAKNFDLTKFQNYVPIKFLQPKLRKWLLIAIHNGVAEYSALVLRGPVKTIPFDKSEGVLQATSQFHNLDLRYNQDWPTANHLTGIVNFNGRQMHMAISRGDIAKFRIEKASADMPYIGSKQVQEVQIKGVISGELSDGLQFLQQSPLKNRVGKYLAGVNLTGPMQTYLNLTIPLKNNKPIVVNGGVTMPGAVLSVPAWGITLDQLTGQLLFSKDKLFARNLQAFLFKQPVTLNVDTIITDPNNPITQIDFAGNANARQVMQQFHLPVANYFTGMTDYRGDLEIQHAQAFNTLNISSDLKGLTISLPKPFAKSSNQSAPLNIKMQFSNALPLQVNINYAARLQAALKFTKKNNQLNLRSGVIHIGRGALKPEKQTVKRTGLSITGHLDEFDWSKWQPIIFPTGGASAAKSSVGTNLQNFDLTIDKFTLFKSNETMSLAMDRAGPTRIKANRGVNSWLVNISGPIAAGDITIPFMLRNHVVSAYLNYFYVPKKISDGGKINFKPQDLPALQIYINNFYFGDKLSGSLNLITSPIKQGLEIEHFAFTNNNLKVIAAGSWLATARGMNTNVFGTINITDLATTLKSLSLPAFADGKLVTINYHLNWPSAPYAPKLSGLSGNADIKICHGNIADVGQKTAANISLGRIITLLSVESIPKRILFHFDDLVKKGFSFDTLKGDYVFKNGVANTQNTLIKAVIADIKITGDISLVKQTFDLRLVVCPHLIASLPVIVAITSGPVAGIITWAASKVLSPIFDHFIHKTYTVKGPWRQPVFTKVSKQNQGPNDQTCCNTNGIK